MSPLCWFRRFATLVLRSQTVGLGFEGIAIGTSGNFEQDGTTGRMISLQTAECVAPSSSSVWGLANLDGVGDRALEFPVAQNCHPQIHIHDLARPRATRSLENKDWCNENLKTANVERASRKNDDPRKSSSVTRKTLDARFRYVTTTGFSWVELCRSTDWVFSLVFWITIHVLLPGEVGGRIT